MRSFRFAELALSSPIIVQITSLPSDEVAQQIEAAGAGALLLAGFNTPASDAPDSARTDRYHPAHRNDAAERALTELQRESRIDTYLAAIERLRVLNIPVIASLYTRTLSRPRGVAQAMAAAGAAAVLVRPFSHGVDDRRTEQVEHEACVAVGRCSQALDVPILCELPIGSLGIQSLAAALAGAGAQGLVVNSTAPLVVVDSDHRATKHNRLETELSDATFFHTIGAVWQLYRRISPHLACVVPYGRVKGSIDALLVGASASVVTVPVTDGTKTAAIVRAHVRAFRAWCDADKADPLKFRGTLSASRQHSSLERRVGAPARA